MAVEKFNTGIAELDAILNDKEGLAIEPMPIDKKIFDNILLPLLKNELSITTEESFDNLRNIWINYYKQYHTNRAVVFKASTGDVAKSMGGNAVFTPMVIKDDRGVDVAVTPPLIEPTMIVGMNAILEEYSNEMRHNPNAAKVKLLNTIKTFTINTNQAWVDFLNSYGIDGINPIDEDDNDDLIIRS